MAALNRFDDRRLREDALKAFVKALHTDRMVAVTGSMATEALGYPKWNDFILAYALIARNLAVEILEKRETPRGTDPAGPTADDQSATKPILDNIKERAENLIESVKAEIEKQATGKPIADKRVSMWTLHELFRIVDRAMREVRAGLVLNNEYQAPILAVFEERVAAIFRSRTFDAQPKGARESGKAEATVGPGAAAIRPLIASLGIKRVATLNYDLELERAFMIRRDEHELIREAEELANGVLDGIDLATNDRTIAKAARLAVKYKLRGEPKMASVLEFVGSPGSGKPITLQRRNHLSRTLGNGIHVESDIVDRERPDRLFEFAIGSAETDRHILHVHGRADAPETMVANIRQYDRLYRLDDLYRDPFDHGLRMLVGGNPIFFIGVGMTEPELNMTLEYFISNVPVRRPAPIFLIWNTDKKDADGARFRRERRLDFLTRLGVHLIFDDDLPRIPAKAARKPTTPSTDKEKAKLQALPAALDRLPALVLRIDRRVERVSDIWRSIDKRLQTKNRPPLAPYRLWGTAALSALAAPAISGVKPRFNLTVLGKAPAKPSAAAYRPLIFAAAPNGYGRGELSEYLAQTQEQILAVGEYPLRPTESVNRLIINAGFSYDSDAMLIGIAHFLKRRIRVPPKDLTACRERYFADGTLFNTRDDVLIIINGVDRFFGFDGIPLSAEFDHMLRCAQKNAEAEPDNHRVQILLLGTSRVRQYSEALNLKLQELSPDARIGRKTMVDRDGLDLNSSYLQWVRTQFEERADDIQKKDPPSNGALGRGRGAASNRSTNDGRITDAAAAEMRRAVSLGREAHTRTFFDAYLAPALLRALDLNCPATFEVLRTICFIGAPVEASVLLHAPKVHAILAERNERNDGASLTNLGTDMFDEDEVRARLARVIRDLRQLGLLIALDPHEPDEMLDLSDKGEPAVSIAGQGKDLSDNAILWTRYGLHRTLATFLRDRHGAPINDAKLATTFNMSLFMSEPSDTTTPEPGFHDELGTLVDSLIGGWHDIGRIYGDPTLSVSDKPPETGEPVSRGKQWFAKLNVAQRANLKDLYVHEQDRERAIDSLGARADRQASACLRAALSIVRGYYSTGALLKLDREDRVATADRDGALTEHAHRLDRLITGFGDIAVSRKMARPALKDDPRAAAIMGPDPFHPDDLVWLHNERAVVALAQGHLFDARDALAHAERVNRTGVEADYPGHNWRRISVNMVSTLIERGSIRPAERRLDQIEVSINNAPWCRNGTTDETCNRRIAAIRALFGDDTPAPAAHGTNEFSREEMFIVAMSTSYRGLIAHMRNRYHEAKTHYVIAVRMLRHLGEQRAYAHFQRQLATLEAFFGDKDCGAREIEFAIAAAQGSKQMDILHRARIVRADLVRQMSQDESKRRHALQDIKDALKYAALSDCYRVRIEASASLARHMRIGGDYDTALRYAADAVTTAARYGHSLQKTSLRIELGRILDARGDPVSGQALLEQAIAIGTSKGYNHALERVRRARTPSTSHRTDIPISG